MKIEKTISLFLSLFLIGAAISCKSSSGAGSGANENRDDKSTLAETNANVKTPVPAAKDCPPAAQLFSPMDLQGSQIEKYVGCTITVSGKLIEVKPDYVSLKDTVGDLQGAHTISCGGSFSDETYSAVSHKLYDLKSKGYGDSKFPEVTFSGRVKQLAGTSSVGLTDCVMTNFSK